jgi:hypothetical protein
VKTNSFTGRDSLILVAIVVIAWVGGFALSRSRTPASPVRVDAGDWLVAVTSTDERARMLQRQLRGFDVTMWEVGHRFTAVHEALARANYDLAVYQWDKIGVGIKNALIRRPGKTAHAQQYLLGQTFDSVRTGLTAKDPALAWQAFARAKVGCESCHGAEGVAYVNAQSLFELGPPEAAPAASH